MSMRHLPIACFVLAIFPLGLAAQTRVSSEPLVPSRGSLIRLRVTPSTSEQVTAISGDVANEPLHLWTSDGRAWTGLAGVPVDGGDTLYVNLVLQYPDRADTVHTFLRVAQPPYPSETLRVAPGMAQPDSAARMRIREDGRKARKAGEASHATVRLWEGPFVLPRTSRITSAFGTARVFNGSVTSRHLGTDFAGAVGVPVRAANRGRVVLVERFYLAGRVVYIDHGEGLISAYFHLSKARVKVGQLVERGQIIGLVGQSGRVTGPHLHWVMRYGNTTVDPLSVVAVTASEGGKGEQGNGERGRKSRER